MTMIEVHLAKRWISVLPELIEASTMLQALSGDDGGLSAVVSVVEDSLKQILTTNVDIPRRVLHRKYNTLDSIATYFGPSDVPIFFQFQFHELDDLIWLLLGDHVFDMTATKRGKASAEEGILLVLCRLRNVSSTFDGLEAFFGRSGPTLCDLFRMTIAEIYRRHRHRWSIQDLSTNYIELVEPDKQAFLNKFNEYSGELRDQLPDRFANCGWAMDGCRQDICEPSAFGEQYYSDYTHSHCQLTIALVSATGLVVGLADFVAGRHADPWLVNWEDVNHHLFLCDNIKVLCDKAFGLDTNIAPFPKANQIIACSVEDISNLSRIRMVVEWAFGEVFEAYPYLKNIYRQKIYATSPATIFHVGVFLMNCQKCMRGSKVTNNLGRLAPTIEWYLR